MNLFKNINIGKRLGLGFGIILALSLLITSIAIWRLQAVAQSTRVMMQQPLAKERMITEWYGLAMNGIVRTTAIAKSSDPSLATFFADEAAAATQRALALQKKIEPLLSNDAEKQLYQKVLDQRKVFLGTRTEIIKLKLAGQADEATQLFQNTYLPAAAVYQKMIEELVKQQETEMDANAARIDATAGASLTLLSALTGLALLFGTVCAWMLTAGITGPLKRAMAAARQVADGDLTGNIVVDSSDEVGQLLQNLKDMNHKLLAIVGQVRDGTDSIAVASGQIAAGNRDLSSRTEQQAGSLEETASSMEELTSTVKQNADNARQANQLALTASDVALRGGSVVAQVVETMGSINSSSRKIADIIAVIDGIAFQTNILALNAAVEAARAGEQGRGFAVVASEVRNLAQRSAAAAKEIKALIDDSVGSVEAGTRLVGQAGSTMTEIVDSIRRVTDIMGEISSASQEQTGGIDQVNRAIIEIDNVTQQNATLVEQASVAAASLQQQAGNLAQVVSVFRLGGVARQPVSTAIAESAPRARSAAATASARAGAKRASAPKRLAASPARATATAAVQDEWETF